MHGSSSLTALVVGVVVVHVDVQPRPPMARREHRCLFFDKPDGHPLGQGGLIRVQSKATTCITTMGGGLSLAVLLSTYGDETFGRLQQVSQGLEAARGPALRDDELVLVERPINPLQHICANTTDRPTDEQTEASLATGGQRAPITPGR